MAEEPKTVDIIAAPMPQPVPMQFRVVPDPEHAGMLALVIDGPTGTYIAWLDKAAARQVGAELIQNAARETAGLIVPNGEVTPPDA